MIQAFPQLLNYVHVTVLITVISAILGVILGSIIAIIRLKKVPVLNQLFIVFISFMRGTPFLVQLFLIYFGVPEIMSHMGLNMKNVPGLVFVYAVFTLHIAAYSAGHVPGGDAFDRHSGGSCLLWGNTAQADCYLLKGT